MKGLVEYLMKYPQIYNFVQRTIAGKGCVCIKNLLYENIPVSARDILDLGCGTGIYSTLFTSNTHYVGIDNNMKDILYAEMNRKGKFMVASATDLPFQENKFDIVFAVGLHHHLNDNEAKESINESIRVLRKSGKLIVVDALLLNFFHNIPGYILRKLDRGNYVRNYRNFMKLIPSGVSLSGCKVFSAFPLDYIAVVIKKNVQVLKLN
jgi:SAM-dependent methyltransferase